MVHTSGICVAVIAAGLPVVAIVPAVVLGRHWRQQPLDPRVEASKRLGCREVR